MTLQEASNQYQIPSRILKEYEDWGLCQAAKKVVGDRQYGQEDLERLSLIMTVQYIGFSTEEVEVYMRLLLEDPKSEQTRLRMLNRRRDAALDELHLSLIHIFKRHIRALIMNYCLAIIRRISR